MRTRLFVVLLAGAAACSSTPAAAPQPAASAPAATGEWGNGTVHRGAPFTVAADTELSQVLAEPAKFAGQTVKTTGTVARACAKKGCWMELQTASGDKGMRVSFKDYAFFVPLDSQGARAVVEGVVEVKTLSAEDAAHLEAEGAKIARNDKGEAMELAFVASGVELVRTP